MSELSPIEAIQRNAEMVIQLQAPSGRKLGYDAPTVEWMEGYIEHQRKKGLTPEEVHNLVNVIGSFLGECIRRNFGGQWASTEYGWGIQFNEKNVTFPFNKVQKQLENGLDAGDSIASYYSLIPALYEHVLGKGNSE